MLRILNAVLWLMLWGIVVTGASGQSGQRADTLNIVKNPGAFTYFIINTISSYGHSTITTTETNYPWAGYPYNNVSAIYQSPTYSSCTYYWTSSTPTNPPPPNPVSANCLKGVISSKGTYVDKVNTAWPAIEINGYDIYRNTVSNLNTATKIGTTTNLAYTDTNLIQNIKYYYWVRPMNGAPDTGWRSVGAPTLTVTKGTYPDRIQLDWTTCYGTVMYEIWRGASNDFTSASFLTNIAYPSTRWSDYPVAMTTNYYWVRANTVTITGSWSSVDYGYVALLQPPTSVIASTGTYSDKITITWVATGAVNYVVYRSLSDDWGGSTDLVTVSTNTYSDTTTEVAIFNYYWIIAMNALQTSSISVSSVGWKKGIPKITGVIASTDRADRIRVDWDDSIGATTYTVFKSTTNLVSTASLAGTSTTPDYDDTAVTLGTTNYYWVIANNSWSTSVISDSAYGWPLVLVPPSDINASDGTEYTKVNITWPFVADANGYRVWRGPGVYPNNLINLTNLIEGYTVDNTAVPGLHYYYFVTATNSIQASTYSRANSGYIGLLATPTLTATHGTGYTNVMVSWNSVIGATGYEVYSYILDQTNMAAPLPETINNYLNVSVNLGETNYYWVKATNSLQTTPFSNSDRGWMGQLAIPSISATKANMNYPGIFISWTSITGATSYSVWRSLTNDSATASNIVNPAINNYTDTGVIDEYWYYWVKATNSVQGTGFSTSDVGWAANLATIPAGNYIMGNILTNDNNDGIEIPTHSVYISTFYMEKYEVTKQLWDRVYVWATNNGYTFNNVGTGKATTHPVYNVSFYDVVKWCNARSEQEGLIPC